MAADRTEGSSPPAQQPTSCLQRSLPLPQCPWPQGSCYRVAGSGRWWKHGGFQAAGEVEAGMGHPQQSLTEFSACGMRVYRPHGRQQHLAPSTACRQLRGKNHCGITASLGNSVSPCSLQLFAARSFPKYIHQKTQVLQELCQGVEEPIWLWHLIHTAKEMQF